VIIDYKLDKPSKHVTPAEILSTNEERIQDLAPWSWWKHEIVEPIGEAKFLKIVGMSKWCLWTSEYYLQVCLLHLPFTAHSLKEFDRPDFKWMVLHLPCTISQAPEL